jgi:hypothetical protein
MKNQGNPFCSVRSVRVARPTLGWTRSSHGDILQEELLRKKLWGGKMLLYKEFFFLTLLTGSLLCASRRPVHGRLRGAYEFCQWMLKRRAVEPVNKVKIICLHELHWIWINICSNTERVMQYLSSDRLPKLLKMCCTRICGWGVYQSHIEVNEWRESKEI